MSIQSDPDLQRLLAAADISDDARDLARAVFSAAPARSTHAGPHNLALRVPNRKSGRSDELESMLELAQFLRLEHDPAVFFFVTQPSAGVVLRCESCTKHHAWPSTPDFFFVAATQAGWIETRTDERIGRLLAAHPGLYRPGTAAGEWECPSAAAYAAERDLVYLVRSPGFFNPVETRNLRYLTVATDTTPDAADAERAMRFVAEHPGGTLADLTAAGFALPALLALVSDGRLYIDITRHVLADAEHVPVYRDAIVAAAHAHRHPPAVAVGNSVPAPVTLARGARLTLGDIPFEVEIPGASEVVLRDLADGSLRTYPRADLERLAREGVARGLLPPGSDVPDGAARICQQAYARASTGDLEAATRRAVLLGLAPSDAVTTVVAPPSERTLRRWRGRQRAAAALTGDPLVGLIPDRRRGGGRRLAPAVEAVVARVIEEKRLVPNPLSIHDITSLIRHELAATGLEALAPVERTVARHIQRLSRHRQAKAQKGRRGANGLAPYRPVQADDTPVDGDRPWQVVHFDSTVLDLETVDPQTGRGLGRPGCSGLEDAYSGQPLVVLLHYEAPCAATALRALRRCVEIWGRLPEYIVLDQAPEFHSEALQRFCAWFGVTIIYRPTGTPRFGAPVERYLLEAVRVVKRLAGQTTARKDPRSLDRSMDPARFAIWDIASLGRLFDDAREQLIHAPVQATGESRLERFERGIARHGVVATRILSARDPGFLAMTLPIAGTRSINTVRGLNVDYLTYWHDVLATPELDGIKVEVRRDPDDLSHAFAYVRGEWVECFARELAQLRVVSYAEWQALCEVVRERNRATRRRRLLYGTTVASLIVSGEETEKSLRARLEAQAMRATPIQDVVAPAASSSAASSAAAVTPAATEEPTAHDGDAFDDDPLTLGDREIDERYFGR